MWSIEAKEDGKVRADGMQWGLRNCKEAENSKISAFESGDQTYENIVT